MTKPNREYQNYYELLDISYKATHHEIKKAYEARLQAVRTEKKKRWEDETEVIVKLLNQAYYMLGHAKRRKNYDEMLRYTAKEAFERQISEEAFRTKLEKAAPVLKKIIDGVQDLFSLFMDAVTGKYKVHPLTLGLVGGGLLYLIIPFDFLPDILPFIGFLDDLTILTTIISTIQAEMSEYRRWRALNSHSKDEKSKNNS
jgi:uncharacterized membrane protein YkvA (DUF1232 family)